MAVVFFHHHRHRLCHFPHALFLLAAVLLLLASTTSARPAPIKETELPTRVGERAVTRRRLSGLGSSPPTCRSMCGSCSPCTAVHVPIQPGVNMPLEYYPEAWRCKCGNSLYIP